MIKELEYNKLKNYVDPTKLGMETTKDIPSGEGIVGQERAVRAIEFGLNIKMKGYNIFVSGLPGTGKTSFSAEFAKKIAETEPVPPDICYIYNFKNPKYPKVLKLPAGSGKVFAEEMEDLINRLMEEIPKLFSNKEFENKKNDIIQEYQQRRDELIKEMTFEAKEQNFGVKTTNSGIYFMPIVDGEIISEEQYENLSQDQKDAISENSESIQKRAADVMKSIKEFEKSTRKEVGDLEYSSALFAVGHHMSGVYKKYADNPDIVEYLNDMKEDILDNIEEFAGQDYEEEQGLQAFFPRYFPKSPDEPFEKYRVNLIVDNSGLNGAPVIVDFNPTYSNLVGEIEYDNDFGNLSTDFMKIKPGLLHKANGGYLIIQAHDLLMNPHAWEALRRALITKEISMEPLREYMTGVAVSGIKPEPVKVNLKIVMVGSYYYYDLLYEFDEEFQKYFRICADFDYEMKATDENIHKTAAFIKRFCVEENTPDFDIGAVVRVMEYSFRLAERQDKLSTRFNRINELLSEAVTWAKMDGAEIIGEAHIKKAFEERTYRLGIYEEKLSELIEKDIIIIDTSGQRVGQINGLAVLESGDYIFAKPSKITATTYVGKTGIINIEKEAEMSGNIHEKGIQVLSGFLGQTYAQDFPLSLSCRICFEQNYSGVDGDSASSTELYAVLSSLSGLPIKQEIAVTGSINQFGDIQPIGGVTYKIEGFFDLCEKRGLTGRHGVIIPSANVSDLMLKDSVIEAVKDGKFHIYAIDHVDEGIEILTGVAAGKKDAKGKYPAASVHGKVYKRLRDYYKKAMAE